MVFWICDLNKAMGYMVLTNQLFLYTILTFSKIKIKKANRNKQKPKIKIENWVFMLPTSHHLHTTLNPPSYPLSLTLYSNARSSAPGVFLGKGVLKTCSKFTGEHPCQRGILIKLLY